MKKINNCTLVCIDCVNQGNAISAIQKSIQQCEFDRVLFLTDTYIEIPGIEVVKIPSIKSKDDYSLFMIKQLWKFIHTDFMLVIQHDGYVLDGEMFDTRLYDYDYAGALWLERDGLSAGNGGFSWRSKRLMDAIGSDELIVSATPEDVTICRVYRSYLEERYGLKWATEEICERFSFELRQPKQKTFGFHAYFHEPYKPTIVLKRSAALGDCIILEPVMKYYYLKGYNVVLDIPKSFFDLYKEHYFPVKHISQFDIGRIRPEKEINLDMAYEVKPRQSYLKSYFEFCGISDYELTRPQLSPYVNSETKLFKKYAVIHIDLRETMYRNVYGVDWKKIRNHLESLGYVVLQIGRGRHESCGIEINTATIGFMKFLISGCDLFVGVDSGPAGIAVAYNKPCVLFFGSVCPDYIHPDLTNVEIIQGGCENSFCWHQVGGTSGIECKFKGTEKYLQCCVSSFEPVVDAINKLQKHIK